MSQDEAAVDGLDLDTSLGYLLKQAASVLHGAMDEVLRPLGMTITHYACLELLAHRPGQSNSELARGTFVTRQSMNTLLHLMERDGLVSRPGTPLGRVRPVELTDLGRRQLTSASAAVRAVEEQLRSGLERSEQDQLRRLLGTCIDSLSAD